MSAVADKLREAKALIERGWTQKVFSQGHSYCAVGAIEKVAGALWGAETITLLRKLRAATKTDSNLAMLEWNDAPGRTQAEVVAAFDRAIELAETEA